MWLHVYRNNVDTKEHLAIVFGGKIRSRSLDAERPGETELDRMTRGAYVGRLYPGRTSSRVEQIKRSEGIPSKRTPDPIPEQNNGLLSPSSAASSENGDAQSITPSELPLVRIHSECYTGETVWSARCDCGEQLDEAARLMADPNLSPSGGAIIYLRQEGRGIGLGEKLKAYNLQDLGNDTYEANILLRHPADARSYGLATAMLMDLGLGGERGIRLLTNNPDKVHAVEGPGREVVVKERVAMVPIAWKTGGQQGIKSEEVEKYLSTKVSLNLNLAMWVMVLTMDRLRSLNICWIRSRRMFVYTEPLKRYRGVDMEAACICVYQWIEFAYFRICQSSRALICSRTTMSNPQFTRLLHHPRCLATWTLSHGNLDPATKKQFANTTNIHSKLEAQLNASSHKPFSAIQY
jgi:GTP cyclohydrolase II